MSSTRMGNPVGFHSTMVQTGMVQKFLVCIQCLHSVGGPTRPLMALQGSVGPLWPSTRERSEKLLTIDDPMKWVMAGTVPNHPLPCCVLVLDVFSEVLLLL